MLTKRFDDRIADRWLRDSRDDREEQRDRARGYEFVGEGCYHKLPTFQD